MSFLSKLIGNISGGKNVKISEQLIFDKVIGFKGLVGGVGTSTVVHSVAVGLSENTNMSVCVLDTNFMNPSLYPMLLSVSEKKRKDLLDFNGVLSEIAIQTDVRNVTLVTLSNRTIVDLLSGKDTESTLDKVMSSLKSFFDVILIDISNEFTQIATYSAIKSNKIFLVTDQSLRSSYNLQKGINTLATLAVPMGKVKGVVLNKSIPDVISNVKGVLDQAGLKVVGEIPLSMEIAKRGVAGKKIYEKNASNKGVFLFSTVIDSITNDIVQVTPLTKKYLDSTPTTSSETTDSVTYETVDDSNVETDDVEETVVVTKPVQTVEVKEPKVAVKEKTGLFKKKEKLNLTPKPVEEEKPTFVENGLETVQEDDIDFDDDELDLLEMLNDNSDSSKGGA